MPSGRDDDDDAVRYARPHSSTAALVATFRAAWQRAFDELEREYGLLRADEMFPAMGAGADAFGRQLVAERRALAVTRPGTTGDELHFPGFQSDGAGGVRLVVAELLSVLEGRWSDEATALWLASPSGWLGGQRPADLLIAAPDEVVRALSLAASK